MFCPVFVLRFVFAFVCVICVCFYFIYSFLFVLAWVDRYVDNLKPGMTGKDLNFKKTIRVSKRDYETLTQQIEKDANFLKSQKYVGFLCFVCLFASFCILSTIPFSKRATKSSPLL